jgi:hypothetical protein
MDAGAAPQSVITPTISVWSTHLLDVSNLLSTDSVAAIPEATRPAGMTRPVFATIRDRFGTEDPSGTV